MPGPPPKPTEQKRRTGNPGGKALPVPMVTLPSAAVGIPRAPKSLERPGRAAWRRLWGVGRAWLSPQSDLGIMTRLCQAYDERAALREVIGREGFFTSGYKGQAVTHPAVKQVRVLEAEMRRMEAVCGFTPADRSRLGMAEVQRVSKLDEFMSKWGERHGAE